ncbi:hypothetical protein V5O48_015105 [Marasmius crinis-equi]|uniref:Uncharacterized protein n=1 Tax=Marasmius crinis-equi TaxID=585013 RepID=A0ABR3EVF4_9AGAR
MDPGAELICNVTTSDLRLIPIKPGHSPHSASWSDFIYALGSVFWLFRQQIERIAPERMVESDAAVQEAKDFVRIVWTRWVTVWPGDEPTDRKDLMQDILRESEVHRLYVRIRAKPDVDPVPWREVIESKITESNFERWADPQFVQAQQPPPTPPPTPFITWEPYEGLSAEESVNRIEREIAEARRVMDFNECHMYCGRGECPTFREADGEDGDWMLEWH